MPSPVGHALAGVAVGFLVGGGGRSRFSSRARDRLLSRNLLTDRRLIGFALMGMLADIDFLVGTHSTHTHSLGAILVVTAAVGCWGRGRGPLLALALGAAYGSHVLLDWLGSDSVAPIGVMELWPFSSDSFLSDRRWFIAVCHEYWLVSCWAQNILGTAREVLILGPLALGAVHLAGRRSDR